MIEGEKGWNSIYSAGLSWNGIEKVADAANLVAGIGRIIGKRRRR